MDIGIDKLPDRLKKAQAALRNLEPHNELLDMVDVHEGGIGYTSAFIRKYGEDLPKCLSRYTEDLELEVVVAAEFAGAEFHGEAGA